MEIKSYKICRDFVSLVFVPRSINDLRMAAYIVEDVVYGCPFCRGELMIYPPSDDIIEQMFKAAEVRHLYSCRDEKLYTFIIMDEKPLGIEYIKDYEDVIGSIVVGEDKLLYIGSLDNAKEIFDFIKGSSAKVLEGEDFETAKTRIETETYAVNRLLEFTKGNKRMTICLPNDWK